jgi:stage II sporulation SpoE-like protein/GAF domain-containing protein
MAAPVTREESAWEPLFARLTERLVEVLSLQETIDVMLEAIVPAFADWMSVYLERPEGGGFEVIAMRHWDEKRMPLVRELIGTSFATESSATASVLRTGRSILLQQYPEDLRKRAILPQYAEHLRALGLRSAIVVPFRRGDKIIGAVHVIRGDTEANFDEHDLALVEGLARRITPAIFNAEAYEHERMVARRFQEAALSASLPAIAGVEIDAVYEAARTGATIGGDWYDVFPIDEERVLVTVGDVAGHGLEAATRMSILRQSLRAFSLTSTSPVRLITLLRRLMEKECSDSFATALVGVLSRTTGVLEYLSAGHPSPLLRQASGAVEELAAGRCVMLGVGEPRTPAAASVTLGAGTLLVLFTDGLTESTRNILEGERKLREVVGSPAVGNARNPAHEIYRTMLPAGSFDDTAVLTIRYNASTG